MSLRTFLEQFTVSLEGREKQISLHGFSRPKGQLMITVIRAPNNTAKYKFVKWLNRTLKGQTNVQA